MHIYIHIYIYIYIHMYIHIYSCLHFPIKLLILLTCSEKNYGTEKKLLRKYELS